MTQKYERILTIYFLIAGVLFLFFFQPVNGYDSPSKKVFSGDTLYEYVMDTFHNPFLTRMAFENFPEPYTYVVYCDNDPIDDCEKRVPLVPDKNILLANTNNSSSDGDTIETKGKEILITKPSGRVDRLPLVTDDQLELKKYTQIVQNAVLAGTLVMIGIVVFTLLSDAKKHTIRPLSAENKGLVRLMQKIFDYKRRMYITWSAIVLLFVLLWAFPFSLLSIFTIVRIIYFHIAFVLFPALFILTFLLIPVQSLYKEPSILKVVVFSILAGMFGTVAFYVVQAAVI